MRGCFSIEYVHYRLDLNGINGFIRFQEEQEYLFCYIFHEIYLRGKYIPSKQYNTLMENFLQHSRSTEGRVSGVEMREAVLLNTPKSAHSTFSKQA